VVHYTVGRLISSLWIEWIQWIECNSGYSGIYSLYNVYTQSLPINEKDRLIYTDGVI
jgi:hypothetical protein